MLIRNKGQMPAVVRLQLKSRHRNGNGKDMRRIEDVTTILVHPKSEASVENEGLLTVQCIGPGDHLLIRSDRAVEVCW